MASRGLGRSGFAVHPRRERLPRFGSFRPRGRRSGNDGAPVCGCRAATDGGTMAPSSMTPRFSGDSSSRRRSPSLRAICRCSSGVRLAMAPSISVTMLTLGSGEKMVGLAGRRAGGTGRLAGSNAGRTPREGRNGSAVPLREKEKVSARGARRRRAQRRRSRQ